MLDNSDDEHAEFLAMPAALRVLLAEGLGIQAVALADMEPEGSA
jgi:hypothetical protein